MEVSNLKKVIQFVRIKTKFFEKRKYASTCENLGR